jgi:hypothetical protein
MTDDLLVWLREQLDEDERVAREAPSVLDGGEWPFWIDVDDQEHATATARYRDHFAPARVLLDIAAKRRIVDGCEETLPAEDAWDAVLDGGSGEEFVLARFTLRMLALPYACRPGYRQEWAP